MSSTYLIALGSNRRHNRYGRPRGVLQAAIQELASLGSINAVSPIIASDPVGPAQRQFANAVCTLDCAIEPQSLLADFKRIERAFGRRRGQVWGDRVLDLDIILWRKRRLKSRKLIIPHPHFRRRRFVLGPAVAVAPKWRDPISGLTIRQLAGRAAKLR